MNPGSLLPHLVYIYIYIYYCSFCVICQINLERKKRAYIALNLKKKIIFTREIYQSACDRKSKQ
jgi:uncharacterized membrane protein